VGGGSFDRPAGDEVDQCVVDTLLQLASRSNLWNHIPPDVWPWLNKLPSLSPVCRGRYRGSDQEVVHAVRELKDVDVLKSYFLIVWSELDCLDPTGFDKMRATIQENFVEIKEHRADLIEHLNRVLGQVGQGLRTLKQHNPQLLERDMQSMKEQYKKLKEVLQEGEEEQ
jgi:hypothetical protein